MTLVPIVDGWTVTAVSGPVPAELAGRPVAATVPGCVHTDLLDAGLIAEPFDGDNEAAQQWIGSTVWRYEASFQWSPDGSARHDLVADGIDTIATIELNGVEVARVQNQHRGYRFDVGSTLVDGANRLVITFDAPVDVAEARDAEHGERPHVNHHPFNSVRKMAANFGWDWGIDVATSGVWKAIGIESWSGARIAEVRPLVGVDGADGVLTTHVVVERADDGEAEIAVTAGGVTSVMQFPAGATDLTAVVVVPAVELWWPVGHGAQPLYDVAVALRSGSADVDTWSGRVGFRTVELDTTPDAAGTPFIVRVNGEAIQVRGANWIPDHAFLTRLDRDRYSRRIDDAVDANMNLLRVWGGGIYESDDFYELCDERGILVWQDFLFACAAYAEEEWLSVEVEAEAREQIARLCGHPSLVIWNGNNENIWGFVEWGWRPKLDGRTWGEGYYRGLFPRLLAELDGTRAYSPGSPYSFGDYLHPNDQHNGTMHIWDVWNQRDYTVYRDYTPRFVSEFGFQGPPAWSTLVDVVHDSPLDPYGHEMLVHQKADQGNLKLERGMQGHLPSPLTIEDWHWATQLNQAHAIRFGVEHFRSLTPHCMGTIVWQLNDNWPVVSWAAVDFNEQRKPLWWALREAYRPRLATIQPREDGLSLVLVNDTAEAWAGDIRLRRLDFDGTELATATIAAAVDARGASTSVLPDEISAASDGFREVIVADTVDAASGFARAVHDFAEVVDQRLDPDAHRVTAERVDGGYLVTVTATSYLRDVALQADRVDAGSRVDAALVTLLAGESARFRISSMIDVDPGAFATPDVVRTANSLLAGESVSR